MNYTQSIGNVVELKCIAKFIEMGYEVSIPYGNGAKYDFVADVNGEFELSLGGDNFAHSFEAESLAGGCTGSTNLWDLIVYGVN